MYRKSNVSSSENGNRSFPFNFRVGITLGKRSSARKGVILVLMALLMVSLLGMLGLVVDSGMMMSHSRQAQNVADAAALAAARDLLGGRSPANARQTAIDYVATYNGMTAPPAANIRIPPTTGAYTGTTGYAEVVLTQNVNTFFVGLVPGVASTQQVTARAVAGYEPHSAGEGAMVLNPDARPGLSVNGNGALRVNGRVVVNSEGGGQDQYGNPINNGNSGTAASGGQSGANRGVIATDVRVVGGVDSPNNFKNYVPGGPNPLKTGQLPEPDPLVNLATPTTALGIDARFRGSVKITNGNAQGLNTDTAGQNRRATQGESIAGGLYTANANDVILHPGLYGSIEVTGGKVYLIPGIYVFRAQSNGQTVFKVTGGTVIGNGVMFYNTGDNFDPTTGSPDTSDLSQRPPVTDGAKFGNFDFTSAVTFSPIKTSTYAYGTYYQGAQAVSSEFNGMLFYQRRRNTQSNSITGNSADGVFKGTLYAKWGHFDVTGQGSYDAQFIIGSLRLVGNGNITILSAGNNVGRANEVYLVE